VEAPVLVAGLALIWNHEGKGTREPLCPAIAASPGDEREERSNNTAYKVQIALILP
jgi:hypothetical protein